MRSLIGSPLLLLAMLPLPAQAHGVEHDAPGALLAEPWVIVSLVLASIVYAVGFDRLGRRSGRRIATGSAAAAFGAAIAVLFAVLSAPADRVADALFSAHMVQHLVLMLVAAPLLVVGRSAMVLLWAIPADIRRTGGSWWARGGLSGVLRPLFSHPVAIWIWFCGAFVFWHLPGPYDLALRHEGVHVLEHLIFVLSAFTFWSVVIEPLGRRRLGYGESLLFVATAAIISSLPGALMILASRPLYGGHAAGVAHWGMTLIQDQQLGGLIMWVPAGFAYLAAISVLFVAWMREAESRGSLGLPRAAPLVCLGLLILVGGCDQYGDNRFAAVGDAEKGAKLIEASGCGACHIIPGIEQAGGLVGPSLDHMGRRIFIAGLLRNTPDNMMLWLRDPQDVVPGNAMPDVGLDEAQARNITAYLFELE